MMPSAVFHLGLHCLQTCLFRIKGFNPSRLAAVDDHQSFLATPDFRKITLYFLWLEKLKTT